MGLFYRFALKYPGTLQLLSPLVKTALWKLKRTLSPTPRRNGTEKNGSFHLVVFLLSFTYIVAITS
jgi:hypothetical protein